MRVLAGVLVVTMLASALLYRRADVRINAAELENQGARVAAQMLVSGDSYANAPRLARMGALLQSFLNGKRSYADCEMAAQIAIARADFEGAIACTEKAIELYGGPEADLAPMDLRMGYLYTLLGQYEDAQEWLDKGLSYGETPEARLTRAQVRLNLGDIQGALEDVDACMAGTDDPGPMLPYMVNVYEAAGEYEKAADCCGKLYEATGEAEYLLNRAYCYTSAGRMDEAEADCAAYAQAGGTQTVQADVMLGLGRMRQSSYREAGDHYIRALDAGYANPESLYYYVVLCAYVTEDYQRAGEYGDRMIQRFQSGASMEQASIDMEDTTGRLDVRLAPMDISSLCLMTGASHMRQEHFDRAVECLTLCLEQSPSSTFARYLRGSCLLATQQYREALKDFDAAIAGGEEEERCRYGRAVCRMQLGDEDGAREDLDWVLLHGSDESLFAEASKLMEELTKQAPEEEGAENGG